MEKIHPGRSIRITPYALAGLEGVRSPDPALSPWDSDERVEAGGDLRMAITPNVNLDLTANTDFAETEVDDQRINLTRFPLFFPERRAFFVERAGTFEVRTGASDILFNSRRVGLTPDGEPVRILGGARLVGRSGKWDFGVFDAQTGKNPSGVRENLGVVRLRRGRRSNPLVGRGDGDLAGSPAIRARSPSAADGEMYLGGDDYVVFALAALTGDVGIRSWRMAYSPAGPFGCGRSAAGIAASGTMPPWRQPGRGTRRRWGTSSATTPSSLRPRSATAGWSPGPGSRVRHYDKAGVSERGGRFRWILEPLLASRSSCLAGQTWTRSREPAGGRSADSLLTHARRQRSRPAAHYANFAQLTLTAPAGRGSVGGGSVRAGEYYDGTLYSLLLTPEWRASAHLRVPGDLQLDRLDFASRDQREWSKLVRLRVLASASPRLSFIAVIQANSLGRLATANLRLRYNMAEGHDLWLVYGHQANLERDFTAPPAPRTARAGLLVKYTRSFGT